MSVKEEKKPEFFKSVVFAFVIVLVILGTFTILFFYRSIFAPNVDLGIHRTQFLYIHTGSDFKGVTDELNKYRFLMNPSSYKRVAAWKKYDKHVKAGRYRIRDGMSNNELINLLRAGKQEPVRVIFQSMRTKEELAGKIASQIEADSVSLLRLMDDARYLSNFNITPATSYILFLPNTYEFFWNTSADQFFRKMFQYFKVFWNSDRRQKSTDEGFTIPQVVTLASILDRETAKDSEKPVIAGVYINRLRKNWPLQADPTLIFAANDYSVKRVTSKLMDIDSPYNTYSHTGLPPGPICIPSVASIDAVLNFQEHHYMYFCAREDLSGYHAFAVTLEEHNRNAKKYQAVMRKLNIR
ncbi:MAG: endolytic transglycosylase MltG [Bacteroidetes bacterium]|nr:endolytic transglycosylase MltG [Bacteroidota bacterium]